MKTKPERREQMESLCAEICHQLHFHEVQYWKDAPGTDRERMAKALDAARDLYAIIRNGLDVT